MTCVSFDYYQVIKSLRSQIEIIQLSIALKTSQF